MNNHFEGLGDKWHCLVDNPVNEVPLLAKAVLEQGGTREAWQVKDAKNETILMAFPPNLPVKAAVVIQGKAEEQSKLSPQTVIPFLEGLPNDLTVEETYTWQNGVEGEVCVYKDQGSEPLWFYTPFLFRDKAALTPGVRHTFLMSALSYGVRRALIDDITISSGAQYEAYVESFLKEFPDKTRLDVPQLKVSIAGKQIIMPGKFPSEYQVRAKVASVEETNFGEHKIYMLGLQFGPDIETSLNVMMYAHEKVCQGYVPKEGDDIDAYMWLQGRLIDL